MEHRQIMAMRLPCYHTVMYKGFSIHYMNGLYKIGNSASLPYLSMNEAKREVDRMDNMLNNITEQLFDNQTQANAQTTNAKG